VGKEEWVSGLLSLVYFEKDISWKNHAKEKNLGLSCLPSTLRKVLPFLERTSLLPFAVVTRKEFQISFSLFYAVVL
jgi:hypothetical protein